MSIIIKSYNFVKETFESEYLITVDLLKDTKIAFNLKVPTNPILDNMIINLNNEPIIIGLNRIQDLILEDDFGYTSRIELIKFISWLGKIYKVGAEYQVQL